MKRTTFRRIVGTAAFLGGGVAISLLVFGRLTGIWFDEVSWLDIPVVMWVYPGSIFLMAIPQRGSEGVLFDGIIIMISIIANTVLYAALAAMIAAMFALLRGGITGRKAGTV